MRPPCNPPARFPPCPARTKSSGPRTGAGIRGKWRFFGALVLPRRRALLRLKSSTTDMMRARMGAALDQLLDAFERQPDEATALSLCEELEQSRHRELIDEMGKRLTTTYASNPTILLAVARMYLRVRRLGDAQGLLVAAGKIAPKNGEVYRWLGEVLLRRGDASRAVKVLERAESLGRRDEETSFWRRQAEAHVDLQNQEG